MRVYNTLSKKIEEFFPKDKSCVKIYTCGPTVYNYAHIGNLRTYVFEDILEKGLNFLGYNVQRVMNITDVGHLESDSDFGEDKMRKQAEAKRKTMTEIADFYTEAFFDDLEKLNVKKPEIVKKASEHIEVYIEIIADLLEKGYGYIGENGNVYFDVSKANNYYELSGIKPEELKVGVREDVQYDSSKRNQTDFVLWFVDSKFKNQEMKWDSPWGVGYPGWHIECSSIAKTYLGDYLDIHCGGVDNIFPHHTNEIAQAEANIGKKWCKYWMHGAHLVVADGKMSKSKGNFLTLSSLEVLPLAYRLFLLMGYYRKELVYTDEALKDAENQLNKLYTRINLIEDKGELEGVEPFLEQFKNAIKNDLNTALMISALYDVLKSDLNGRSKLYLIEEFDKVLSLDLIKTEEEIPEDIRALVLKREEYKSKKKYDIADQIRDDLINKGFYLIDTKEGTKIEKRG